MSQNAIVPSLTKHQTQVWEKIMQFLMMSGEHVFILRGYAGTGKTFLLRKLVDHLVEEGDFTPVLMAPTGRAAEVLRRVTRYDARTIHSQLFAPPQIEEQDDDGYFLHFPLKHHDPPGPTLWIIDEASMLTDARTDSEYMQFGSGSLLNDLIRAANLKARRSDRVLFVGDPAQLPPVGDSNFSPALDAAYLRDRYQLRVAEAELTEIMRQGEGSGILQASLYLRDIIDNQKNPTMSLPEGPGLMAINWNGFFANFPMLSLEQHPLSAIVLTHTNDQAYRLNEVIRRARYGQQQLSIQEGDWLMVDRNFYVDEHIIYNGTHVRVLESNERLEERGITLRGKKGKPGHFVTLRFRKLVIEAPHPETSQMFTLPIRLLENSIVANKRLDSSEQRALFVDFKIRHPNWSPGSERATETLLKDPYMNALQARYGYAITVHKAQGGEWPDVFVNFNASFPKHAPERWRWAYTAVTRAKMRLFGLDLQLAKPLPPIDIAAIAMLGEVGTEARYTPTLPLSGNHPEEFLRYPFLAFRHLELSNLSRSAGLTLRLALSNSRLNYTFLLDNDEVTVSLPYSRNGLKAPMKPRGGNKSLRSIVEVLLQEQPLYAVPGIPPEGPRRIWYEHIRARAANANWGFSHFYLREGKDEYWFRTENGYLRIDLLYDEEGKPTTLAPACQADCTKELRNWLGELGKFRE
ncbi:MAG: AAA family ATPase [Bacteroidia bacterium]|nr:AAA family ATPase [Bacteroidia bacterium]